MAHPSENTVIESGTGYFTRTRPRYLVTKQANNLSWRDVWNSFDVNEPGGQQRPYPVED